jgi:hypothetical protein
MSDRQASVAAAQPVARAWSPAETQELIRTWRLRFWTATALVVCVMAAAMAWTQGPSAVSALWRVVANARTRTIATAASFSVSAGTFTTEQRAAAFAAALDASGLPVLVRQRPDDDRYQVMVGPYVSTDEAERAQRALASWGLGDPRLVVDDTMRGGAQRTAMVDGSAGGSGVVIIAAPGMSSVVFEMPTVPTEVEASRASATTIDIEIGSPSAPGDTTILNVPEGVLLTRAITVESAARPDARRAHLVVPADVQSRLRLEGRRVYVDLAWPKAPWQTGERPAPVERDLRVAGAVPATRPAGDETTASRAQLQAAIDRFEQIQPFLMSATESPDPNVLAALAHTLDGLRDSLAGMTPPAELVPNRQRLAAAVAMASNATTPTFAGDRVAAARAALELFDEARK